MNGALKIAATAGVRVVAPAIGDAGAKQGVAVIRIGLDGALEGGDHDIRIGIPIPQIRRYGFGRLVAHLRQRTVDRGAWSFELDIEEAGAQLVELVTRRLNLPDDTVLVDQQRHRHDGGLEQVERVDQDRPAHLLPLHEEAGAVGMLLLDDADHLQVTGLLPPLGRFVPPGHVHAAARSPGGEDVEHHLVAAEVRQPRRGAVLQRGEGEVGEDVTHGEG